MTRTVDLNADAGESLGRWRLGADDELAEMISSINVACGWHAGDPATMTRAVRLARRHDIALGAHPGFPDLVGFGRRMMAFSPQEAAEAVLYQYGALRAIAAAHGVDVVHVKPHGSLYGLVSKDDEVADAVADAVGAAAPDVHLLLEAGHPAERQRGRGHRVVAEGFADLEYTAEGGIIIDPSNQPRDPGWCAAQTEGILAGQVPTVAGGTAAIDAASVCLHSDRPGAADNARAVVEAIGRAGFTVAAPGRQESDR